MWGDHGQEALENAHVCLINATASGTEILKNLVLPGISVYHYILNRDTYISLCVCRCINGLFLLSFTGIGAFTLVDGHKVSGEDVGNKYVYLKTFLSIYLSVMLN